MKPDQKHIYYLLGDDDRSALHSPHLDIVRHYGYPVLLLTDPVDAFLLVRLTQYKDFPLSNVATAELALPERAQPPEGEARPALDEQGAEGLIGRFKTQLGERVTDVRMTERLSDSPARLVDPEGALEPGDAARLSPAEPRIRAAQEGAGAQPAPPDPGAPGGPAGGGCAQRPGHRADLRKRLVNRRAAPRSSQHDPAYSEDYRICVRIDPGAF